MSKRTHSVTYNVVMNVIVMTSAFIFPLITVPYISRVLLEYGNGLVSFAQNFTYYFAIIASMGVASYGVVACSRVRDDEKELAKTVLEILTVLAAASLLLSAVYLVAILVVPRFGDARALYIFMITSIWTTAFSLEWFFQAIEQYDYITIRALVVRTIGTICIFIFVKSPSDYLVYAIITVLTQGVSCIINLVKMCSLLNLSTARSLRPLRHVKPMLSYLVMNVSKGMTNKSDILVLGFIGTTQMVGVYQIASKIENMVVAAVESVGSVLLPRLTSYKKNEADSLYTELLAYGVDFALLIGCFCLGGIILCADSIVGILGGEMYSGAIEPLIATAPAILFVAGTNVISQVLLINGDERVFALTNLVGLFVSVGSAVALIPAIGITGSGLAVTIGQSAVFFLTLMAARSYLKDAIAHTDCLKIIISGILAFASGLIVAQLVGSINVIARFLVIGFAFTIAFLAMLLVLRENLVITLCSRYLKKSANR